MIELKNLSKRYGDKLAVNNLNINFDAGRIIGFIGPNGAGKTTTLKMMTGITKPTTGSVVLNSHDILEDPLNAKKEFGFVFDSPDTFLQLTGLEYINFIANIYRVNQEDKNKLLLELAQEFELTDALNDKIDTYSHGMRQKIMIIGVLIHNPNIWLLDEPLTGLDPKSSFKLKELMRDHANKGNTVLFSTHVLEVAEKLCDEIFIIDKGEIKYQGTLSHLKEQHPDKSLEEIFLEVTK